MFEASFDAAILKKSKRTTFPSAMKAKKMLGRKEGQRQLPYRVLLVVIIGGMLALVLAAFSDPAPLSPRTLLLLFAALLLLIAVAVEIIFRDISRLRSHDKERQR